MSVISIKELLETGAHFGHQTKFLNPKMVEYIHSERDGIHIIDLQKTLIKIDEAYQFVSEIAADGGKVLFVATKNQAKEAIKEEAERCGSQYITDGWIDGTIVNMERLPDIIFIVDTKTEQSAIKEAVTMQIPIIAMIDTNGDPENIDYVIPINDDSTRTIQLIAGKVADIIIKTRDDG